MVQFPARVRGFLYSTLPGADLGPSNFLFNEQGCLCIWVKWSGREADLSSSFNAEIKNEWSYAATPPYFVMA
jgi:hypothetical protein